MARRQGRRFARPRGEDAEPEDEKSSRRILDEEIESGLVELERKASGLLLSGLSAGLDIGFGVIVMASVVELGTGHFSELTLRMLVAGASTIGFVFVVLGRSELFTEHTTLAAIPVLAGVATVRRLLRLWGLVYVANLVGAFGFAALAAYVAPALHVASPAAFHELARRLVDHDVAPMLLSAVLAGWLMGLVSWLVTAARDTTAKLLVVVLITGVIGFAGFHHSILGAVEVIAGVLLAPDLRWSDALRFLVVATTGNAIGGVFFVALIKYGHASRGAG